VPTDRIEAFDPSATLSKSATALADTPSAQGVVDAALIRTVTLGPLPSTAATPLSKRSAASDPAAVTAVPVQIGQARSVSATANAAVTGALLQWKATPRGTQAAALAFRAQGSKGVRLGVWVQALPAGAVLRFYGAPGTPATEVTAEQLQQSAVLNVLGGADTEEAHTSWSPDFGGPVTTLELEIPAGAATAAVQIAVPRLSHYTLTADEAEGVFSTQLGESGSCEVDVACRPEYAAESRSVARMVFVSGAGTFVCTGTMLNDAASSGTPYFLSANHCISTQAEASSLMTDWFYRATSCGGSTLNPGTRRLTGGATLLYATSNTDTSFMRLNDAAPSGILYAGTYFGDMPSNAGLAGLHQPQGDVQKISLGTLLRYSTCVDNQCLSSTPADGSFLTLNWQSGTTEGGSSGSGAFVTLNSKRYVVGQLLGGTASCSAPNGVDFYGRFDTPYRAVLRQWLSPGSAS
jgi:lysyl endopeptidase